MQIELIRDVMYLKKTDAGFELYLSLDGGSTYKKIKTISHIKPVVTNILSGTEVEVGDYSDGTTAFVKYTPPTTAEEGQQIVVIDTGNPGGKRLYIYANGSWHYVNLS